MNQKESKKSILQNQKFKPTDYWPIIHKHIDPKNTLLYRVYVTHVTLVTQKALKIAHKLNLNENQIRFIEEAGMLHDIGIITTDAPDIGCFGKLPYICHGTEGNKILESEELNLHARVAETHTGVGITIDQIEKQNLPIPKKDMVPTTIEEEIISWADLFYSKNLDFIWLEKTKEQARQSVAKFGEEQGKKFDEWAKRFSNLSS